MRARSCLVMMALAAASCGGDNGASDAVCQEHLAEYQQVADELGSPLAPFQVTPGSGESAGMALIGINAEAAEAREADPDSSGMTGDVYSMYTEEVAPAIEGMIEGNCVEAYAEATRAVREASGPQLVAPTELGN